MTDACRSGSNRSTASTTLAGGLVMAASMLRIRSIRPPPAPGRTYTVGQSGSSPTPSAPATTITPITPVSWSRDTSEVTAAATSAATIHRRPA